MSTEDQASTGTALSHETNGNSTAAKRSQEGMFVSRISA